MKIEDNILVFLIYKLIFFIMNKRFLSVALFGALMLASTGTFTSCKDYDDDINGLQEQVDANKKTLDEKLTALQTAMDKASADVTAAKAAAAAAQAAADKAQATGDAAAKAAAAADQAAAAAKAAAAQAKVDAIAEATKLVNDLKAIVDTKVDQSVYDAKMKVIDAHLAVIDGRLDSLEAADIAIKQQIAALEAFKASIDALNLTTAFPALQAQVTTLVADLQALSDQVSQNATDITTLKADLLALSNRIDTIEENVTTIGNSLNTLISLLSHRLTDLTFAPTEFINGIEVINFTTLQYTAWTNLLADESDGSTTTSINDGKTTATYYASPSSVKKADIKTLSILAQDATNTTRAAGEDLISVALNEEIVNGKMVVNLKKNTTDSFAGTTTTNPAGNTVEKFILVALKAEIELTADEIKNGMKPVVTSDWARLAETAATPYIHNKTVATDPSVPTRSIADDAHFYAYTTIHDNNDVCTTAGQYIIKSIPYTESLDLNTLVDVCDKANHRYSISDYNLAFEFALVSYNLKANGEEKQDQKLFARIDDKGVMTSQARNGAVNNRDAIGREPLVQVVLRDKGNNQVVDVRYFKIQWTAKKENTDLGNLGNFTGVFDATKCNTAYVNTVGEVGMNSVYTKLNIAKDVFHQLYELDDVVYATAADAVAGTPASTNLGSIAEITAPGSTMTYNLNWTLPIADCVITPDEYAAGKAIRTVYGRYINKVSSELTCTFELKLELTIAQMAFIAGYQQSYWKEGDVLSNTNKDKTFLVNPALTSDLTYGIAQFFDCQIIASMLKAYNINNVTIDEPKDLVSNAQNAKFVFDTNRLSVLGTGWSVDFNGCHLYKNGVPAAYIELGTGFIRLQENPLPTSSTHGTPTSAAKELLGKSVPVKLVATYCNGADGSLTAELDHFMVKFINPLEIALANVTDSFKDLITGGSTISISNIATIKETFGLKRTVWENGAEANATLGQWYDVKNVTWNLDEAKTNLKKDGNNIIITNDPLASNWSEFSGDYKLTASPDMVNATSLKFENNSGAALQQAIKIAVPVYATTKWAPKLIDADNQYVILTVNPGTTTRR
ncbi:hypothetical protein [Bacteroides sp.]|uniref:hypothetical protein n=1 Tax=Bacteroides sp. TaxID=29523 RepID=UPI002FC6B8C4